MSEQNKKKVLVVDDNKELCDLLHDNLASDGIDVFGAYDGEEGLALALEHRPDLILLDVIMPKVDGWEMLKRLREDDWGAGAEVIMLTNAGDMDSISQAVDFGTFEYLIKTEVDIGDIAKKVHGKLGV